MYLSVHVSSNKDQEYKSAIKVMVHVMGNSLAKEYSFKGQRGKNSFSDLKLWTGVKGAILCKLDTDLAESERAVKSWLKDAAYRSQLDGYVTSKKIQQGTSTRHQPQESPKNI
ncbi:uncharacterized protein LOC124172452 [Ischnura elegans]|uniref:uncharacterized protein LOC124172452 n=1 Tax=Ischnura elegans TaxID=197161 RepID=UPI001ED8B63D|nr:uncharacterized protein LOC124172452 [Ischnura elegans]